MPETVALPDLMLEFFQALLYESNPRAESDGFFAGGRSQLLEGGLDLGDSTGIALTLRGVPRFVLGPGL
jgi:hypothetical protein